MNGYYQIIHILLITNYLSQLRMLRYLSSSSSSSSSSANVPSQKQCSQCKQEKEISHFISKQNEKIVTINSEAFLIDSGNLYSGIIYIL